MYYLKLTAGTALLITSWIVLVAATAFYGWWMMPIATTGDTEEFFNNAVNILVEENLGNAAFILIEDGSIYGEYYSTAKEPIDRDTLFATASMSKWLTANGVMKLVQDRRVDLDAPVASYLSRWELPPGEFDNDTVTVRHLLSHTAGLRDGLGFGDYGTDEVLPTLEESLADPRTSDGRKVELVVQAMPGTVWNYSGGSYLILQLLIEEVSGMAFEEFMREEFFIPLNMRRSTYRSIDNFENNAGSYDRHGEPAPIYQYASGAATGFATSSADLSRFVLAQLPNPDTESILNRDILESMREPHGRTLGIDVWGLGTILYAPTGSGDSVFGHDGGNDPAINSTARINPDNGDAIIILETGHLSLATNIASQWVLWQTGYPDVLDSDSVIQSMFLPAILGTILLLLAAILMGSRRYRQTSSAREQKGMTT